MYLAKISINRPIMITMILLLFIIFGGISYIGLNLNQMPDVEIPYVTITTIYPGAGPKEIETQVTKKIEDVVATVSQIEVMDSYSLDGVSIIIIEFDLTKDVDIANQEIKDKVDPILNELPDDAELPIIQKIDAQAFPIMDLVLSGNLDARELYEIADKTLKDRFSQIEGVAKVDITGGQEREIQVQFNNKEAFENSLSLPHLMQVLATQNMDIPGGYFNLSTQEYTVRLEGEFTDLDEMRNLQILTPFGPKKLRQIAEVKDGGKKIRQKAVYFNNMTKIKDENVVRLSIVKAADGNVVDVAEEVASVLPEIREVLPKGCNLEIINDNSEFVKASVDDTMSNILLGILFTSIVLLIFLHDLRSTFIIAMSMPTSIISSFLLMSMFDLSLNMMTLMGLSVSVGVLVANSVVVLENIFRHKNMGKQNNEAAYIGAKEVTVAVVASTLTNLVVFLPMANMSSMVGQFLVELALAASFATIFSLIMSFTLTPMLSSLILPKGEIKEGFIARFLTKMEKSFELIYKTMLKTALKNRIFSLSVIVIAFSAFIASILIFFPNTYNPESKALIGFEFMPSVDDGKIKVKAELPVGYNLEATSEVMNKIEDRLKKYEEVKFLLTNLGKLSDIDLGTNMAVMDVTLVDANERDISLMEMIDLFIKDLADIPNAKIVVEKGEGMGIGAPIEFYLLGQELSKLEELKVKIWDDIKDVPGLINFDNSSRAGKPEITVYPKRDRLAEAGLDIMTLALTLRASIEGFVATQYREHGNEYDILITLDDNTIDSPEKIGQIAVVTPTGTYRLSQLADVKFTQGFTKVLHRDKYTGIKFTGSPANGVPLGDVSQEIERRLEKLELPSGYRIKWGGNTKMMNEMVMDMAFAFVLAILLTYMLLAAILESFLQPFFILLTLPLAMIGVFISLYWTSTAMGISSLMSIIMLIGIVVNNAILMLDYTNQLRREDGMLPKEALIKACPTKLKPIIMSTVAIILGMLPLAMGIGSAGKEMRMPLGIVGIGGLAVSTVLTLFVIPAFYYLTSRNKKLEDNTVK